MSRRPHVYAAALRMVGACSQYVGDGEQRRAGDLPADAGSFADAAAQPDGNAQRGGSANPGGNTAGGSTGGDLGDGGPANSAQQWQPGLEDSCGNGGASLAPDLRIRELSLYQAVKIPLFKDGAWIDARNATIVQGKRSFLRIFVEPRAGYRPRTLRAVLTLDNDGQRLQFSTDKSATAASTDEAADSTFDFAIAGALIGPNTQLSVALVEPACLAQLPAASDGARVPAAGLRALGAARVGALRVVLVPVSLGGRAPDTGDAQLTRIRDALLAYYPVAEVALSVRAPLIWPGEVRANGAGWSELLNEIGRARQRDAVARDVYYFGLITPSASFGNYCRGGCVLGIAPETTYVSPPDQIGLGIGFVDANTYSTMVHELGHAHGRTHAPCVPPGGSIQSPDPRFPYAGGKIGSWGWDSRSGELLQPTLYADVMSYCEPNWISDYNYEALAARSRDVNTAASILAGKAARSTWRRVILFADGRARWAGVDTHETPARLSSAKALDAAGGELGEVSVARVPLSHSADGFVYLPELEPAWAALDLGDRTLVLDEIEPVE